MERVFLKDYGKIKAGEIRDYPGSIWKRTFPGYSEFTKPTAEVVASALSPAKGREARHAKTNA